LEFAVKLVALLYGDQKAKEVSEPMLFASSASTSPTTQRPIENFKRGSKQ